MDMVICPHCGFKDRTGFIICPRCGKDIYNKKNYGG